MAEIWKIDCFFSTHFLDVKVSTSGPCFLYLAEVNHCDMDRIIVCKDNEEWIVKGFLTMAGAAAAY